MQDFKFCIGYLLEVVVFGIRASTRQRQGRSNFGKPLLGGIWQHQVEATKTKDAI
jgi:hypothetical protein